jgi:hypothetical protein
MVDFIMACDPELCPPMCALLLRGRMVIGVSKKFGEWYQKINKTDDIHK